MTNRSTLTQNPTLLRRNMDLAAQVVHYISEGSFCALLGPHYSGKTGVVRAVEDLLREADWPCVYLDLYEVEASTHHQFFAALAGGVAGRVGEPEGEALALLDPQYATSAAFRGFLTDTVRALGCDMVLILDHLEALPNDLVQALLTSLRAAYMEQQMLEYRVMVIVSGALSLASVTVGESSPFRGIARRVFVGGLSEDESAAFISEQIEADWIEVAEDARHILFQAARGDPRLLWRIYRDAAQLARDAAAEVLEAEFVEQIVTHFLDDEVLFYAPLQEAVRTIEQDPDLLGCLLLLLEHELVPPSQLPLPLSPDLDPLRLTGVVEKVDDGGYRLRNNIYRRFLARHFDPGRVGHLLTISGRWDSAIDYLESSVSAGNEQYRWDLMTAIINSIYASDDIGHAAHFVLRGLSALFGVAEAQVWHAPLQELALRLAAYIGPARPRHYIAIGEDCLEARAYREAAALRGAETKDCVERALPLLAPGRRPVGVVTIQDCPGDRSARQRDRELELTGFLNQAARALEQVGKRTRELSLASRVQASLLPESPNVPGWDMAAILLPARQVAGDFFDFIRLPNGRLGIVVADVTDKGMGAALYMALSRTLVRTYATDHPTQPEHVLRATSARMLSDAGAGLFVTVFYGILDPVTGWLIYCNAGHHPPYLMSPDPEVAPRPLGRTGMALGVIDEAEWHQESVQIAPGELLLLYTDGVVEAQNANRDFFGSGPMLDLIQARVGRPSDEVQDTLLDALRDFAGTEAQSDDITLVLVRRELVPVERERPEAMPRVLEPRTTRRPGPSTA